MKRIIFILILPILIFSCSIDRYSMGENQLNKILENKFSIEKQIGGVVNVKLEHISSQIYDSKIHTKAKLNISSFGVGMGGIMDMSYGLRFENNKLYLKDLKIEKITDNNGNKVLLDSDLIKVPINYILEYLVQTPIYDFTNLGLPLNKIVNGVEIIKDKINFSLE